MMGGSVNERPGHRVNGPRQTEHLDERCRCGASYPPDGSIHLTWVKLDDQFFLNPKSVAAGKDGRELYLAGLCYCASQLTDGWIAQAALPIVAASAGVKPSTARVLERVGLWEDGGGGFWVHDYLEFNPTAKDVRAGREQRAEAGRRGGKQKAANLLASRQRLAIADGT